MGATGYLIVATIFGIRLIVSLSEYLLRLYWHTRRKGTDIKRILDVLLPAIKAATWAFGIIFVLDNLGFDVSAVLAGIGIDGVAVALASQGVLQDLFSYFSILFDRPFDLGNFIIVDDFMGTVQHIGIKTTRIQSLSGEKVVISNKDYRFCFFFRRIIQSVTANNSPAITIPATGPKTCSTR